MLFLKSKDLDLRRAAAAAAAVSVTSSLVRRLADPLTKYWRLARFSLDRELPSSK